MANPYSLDSDVNYSKSNYEWISGTGSFIAHILVLILLALWTVRATIGSRFTSIETGREDSIASDVMELSSPESTQIDHSPADLASSMPSVSISSTELPVLTTPIESNAPSAISLTEVLQQTNVATGGGNGGGFGFTHNSFEGRSKGNRAKTAMANGGTLESERAVEMALAYLARHQSNDGSWSMRFDDEPCNGECSPSCTGLDPYHIGSTGLALLCFLGAGRTTSDEEYGTNVSKGIYYLVQTFRRTSGAGYWLGPEAGDQMYEHGIATLALTEALQMNEAEDLREVCQLAINFIVEAQFKDGSWNYHPREPGDLSIVAWQAMALKSAVAAKIAVPRRTITGIDRYLEHCRAGEFMFRYRDRRPTQSMTAIGVLMLIFRGKSKDAKDIGHAMEYLHKQGPSETDMYYNYYATQAMFQIGEPYWKHWNYYMRDYLIRNQELQGHMAGSWYFERDYSNKRGGRFYVTCMACLILEVYYRYLPVYGESTDDFRM